MVMRTNTDMATFMRLLRYAVEEAEILGVNEIAWANGLSGGSILIEVGSDDRAEYIEIQREEILECAPDEKVKLRLVTKPLK